MCRINLQPLTTLLPLIWTAILALIPDSFLTTMIKQLRHAGRHVVKVFEHFAVTETPTVQPDCVEEPEIHDTDPAGEDEDELPDRDDDDGERVNWTPLRKLPDVAFRKLLLLQLFPGMEVSISRTDVLWRRQGAYHYNVCVSFFRNNALGEYVVRIPGHGNSSTWTEEDAHNLTREVDTMRLVHQHTDVPVPEIFGYSATCDNSLGHPFILMQAIDGESAFDFWFGGEPYDWNSLWKTADEPPPEIEQKRVNFLRSLARCMSSLESLTFTKIGLPAVDESITVDSTGPHPAGHSYHYESTTDIHEPTLRPAFSNTQDFLTYGLDHKFDDTEEPSDLGARKVMEIVFAQAPFNPNNDPETFTLHHNDLDLQNIIIDDDGDIVGIIDWDGAYAAPRCIGAAAVPKFLRKDWMPAFDNGIEKPPFMAWNTEHYRQIYAAAYMLSTGPYLSDAELTTKSAIYQAAVGSLFDASVHDFVDKLLREVPNLRISTEDVKVGLGQGWPACEKMLEREIKKIMEPELPKVEYMEAARKAAMEDEDDMEEEGEEIDDEEKEDDGDDEEEDENKENDLPQDTLSDSDGGVEAEEST
jgi:hypothetical protein